VARTALDGLQVLAIEYLGENFDRQTQKDTFPLFSGIHIAPGEKHWHGACPEESMSHLAVNLGGPAQWMEKVTDEEYTRSLQTP